MVAAILSDLNESVSVFPTPPETLNPPAYVCGYPRTVTYDTPTFATDQCSFQLLAFAGPNDPDTLDALLSAAKAALRTDTTLGGIVMYCHPTEQLNWRRVNIAGSELLAGELTLEIRM